MTLLHTSLYFILQALFDVLEVEGVLSYQVVGEPTLQHDVRVVLVLIGDLSWNIESNLDSFLLLGRIYLVGCALVGTAAIGRDTFKTRHRAQVIFKLILPHQLIKVVARMNLELALYDTIVEVFVCVVNLKFVLIMNTLLYRHPVVPWIE